VALALHGHYAPRLRDRAWTRLKTAKPPDATTRSLLRPGPGLGESLRLGRWDDLPAIHRFPRSQDFRSYCRRGKGAQAAAATMGTAALTWVVSAAAVLLLRDHPAAQQYRARVEKQQRQGTACPVRAQTVARAVSDMRTRAGACETHTCVHGAWRRAGEPEASLDGHRLSLPPALCKR
jgi:hypothetical protein